MNGLTNFHKFIDVIGEVNVSLMLLVKIYSQEPDCVGHVFVLGVYRGEACRVDVHSADAAVVLQTRDEVTNLGLHQTIPLEVVLGSPSTGYRNEVVSGRKEITLFFLL